MKTLKEVRLEYIRSILEDNGWDFRKASDILKIPESRLRREARTFVGLSTRGAGKSAVPGGREDKKK